MPYANNGGVRIHYQVRGDGSPLVMHHGGLTSMEDWDELGYVNQLEEAYQLILFDARGNGASDKPHNRDAYGTERMVSDVVAVLNDLNVKKAHYMGYSLGGWIGFGIAKYAPKRFHSLIIGGIGPYGPSREVIEQRIKMFREGMEAVVAAIEERRGVKLSPAVRARILAADAEALVARLEALRGEPDLDSVLPNLTMPCLVYMGEGDERYPRVEKWIERMPNVTFVSLPGLDHGAAYERSDLVLPHVTRFLETVGQV